MPVIQCHLLSVCVAISWIIIISIQSVHNRPIIHNFNISIPSSMFEHENQLDITLVTKTKITTATTTTTIMVNSNNKSPIRLPDGSSRYKSLRSRKSIVFHIKMMAFFVLIFILGVSLAALLAADNDYGYNWVYGDDDSASYGGVTVGGAGEDYEQQWEGQQQQMKPNQYDDETGEWIETTPPKKKKKKAKKKKKVAKKKKNKKKKSEKSPKLSEDKIQFLAQLYDIFKKVKPPPSALPKELPLIQQQQQQLPPLQNIQNTIRSDYRWDPNTHQQMMLMNAYQQQQALAPQMKQVDDQQTQIINIQLPIKNVVRHRRREQRRMIPRREDQLSSQLIQAPGVATKICEKIHPIIRDNLNGINYREQRPRSPPRNGSIVLRQRNPISPFRLGGHGGGAGGGNAVWSPYQRAFDPWFRHPQQQQQQRQRQQQRQQKYQQSRSNRNDNNNNDDNGRYAEEALQESYFNIYFDNNNNNNNG
ncbi:uncharacterized protein LOC124495834 [Dermatophagoides farinae]|uniref:uncharacterized protein LOC124495834 n=1 Tax=Dermatophagoides farinae TaxID=6954 RepID=UPI001F0EE554|nr:putative uncharacterized protein DDB_G0274435 [Dermatophagoides farinae]